MQQRFDPSAKHLLYR